MPQSLRLKFYLVLFSILFSAYLLVPTFLHLGAAREEVERKGKSLPWYYNIFPEQEINLGLDLRGGIYLELEVSVDEAIHNRIDLMASDLARFMKEENIQGVSIDRVSHVYRIRAMVPDTTAAEKLRARVKELYREALDELKTGEEFVYQSSEKEEGRLQAQYSELLAALKENPGVADITRSAGSNLFRIILKDPSVAASLKNRIASQFPTLHETEEPHKLVFQFSQDYLDKLRSDSIKQAVEAIRNRIDRYGVAEPSIRPLGSNRVSVELPGVKDPDRAIDIIKQAGKLEFRLVDDSVPDDKVKALVAEIRAERTHKNESLPAESEGQSGLESKPLGSAETKPSIASAHEFSYEAVRQINEAARGKIPADDEILFELLRDPTDKGSKKIKSGIPYLVKKKAEVTGDMLSAAQVEFDERKGAQVSLSLNNLGAKIFGELTAANTHKRLAIILDGNVNAAPIINEAIPGGRASITLGQQDPEKALKEAEDLVLVLREGALPASLQEVTKTIVGPSLGQSAIHQGLMAAFIAGLTVTLFMMLYYKFSGVVANIALVINVLLIMGILSLFQATLTLSGIAGIVLTMGMALDANVIIFERIREELKSGKAVRAALESGFSNAWTAVFDTHLTTFLSGMVLYQFGTGPIRGFAVTLMVGVLTTFFTAYWVTKLIYEYLVTKVGIQKVSI